MEYRQYKELKHMDRRALAGPRHLSNGGAIMLDEVKHHDACALCGKPFLGIAKRKYCTDGCSKIARRANQAEAERKRLAKSRKLKL